MSAQALLGCNIFLDLSCFDDLESFEEDWSDVDIPFSGDLSDAFFGLRLWWREITEVKCKFHHTKSRVYTISMIYPC